MRTQLLVPFEGPGSGTEELSWAQRSMWASITREGSSITLGGTFALPEGTSEDVIAAGLRFLFGRHQALRTRYEIQPDASLRQVLYSSGEFSIALVDAADRDPAVVAEELHDAYQTKDFDYPNEWPLRMAVVKKDGRASYVVAVYLHLALDAGGLRALLADLASMDPETGESPNEITASQPFDQARWQRTPAAVRQSAASLRHLEKILRTVSLHRFLGPEAEGEPSFPRLDFQSPATRLAVRAISQRLSVDTSQILLALFGIAVTRITGNNPFLTILAVSNRFRPGFADSVSQLAQVSPCMIDFADCTLDEAIGRARRAAVSAYKYGYYNPVDRRALIEQINADRGAKVDMSCIFNDRRTERDLNSEPVSAEQIRAALPDSVLNWPIGVEEIPETIYFSVDDAEDAVRFELSADIRYLPRERMEELARSIETLAVQAALEPGASTLIHTAP